MSRLTFLFLAALIFGLVCRFYNLNWDAGLQLHPDERFCVDVLFKIGPTKSWSGFFDSSFSPLNPANYSGVHYVYGQLPLFIGKIWLALRGVDSNPAALLELRFLSALFDCGTVVLTVLLARRVWEWKWSLLAGCGVSLAALHVQSSHFFTTDTFAAFFGVASFGCAWKFYDSRRLLQALGAGFLLGLALACKISALFFGVPLLVFVVGALWKKPQRARTFGLAFVGLAAMILAFRLGHPMAFRGELWAGIFDLRPEPRFWSEVAAQAGITRGEVDVPFNIQWIGRPKWLFSAENLGFWGYGWPLLISAIAGAIWFLKNGRRENGFAALVAAGVFCLLLFGVQGATFSKFSRYFLPMTPFVALFAAYFWRDLAQKNRAAKWGAVVTVAATFGWCFAVTSIYSREHPRIAASRWIARNIPPLTTTANETSWDETLPLGGITGVDPNQFRSVKIETYDVDSPEKRERLIAILNSSEWIFFSSGRSWQNIPRWPAKYPMMTAFYAALENGSLGFERAREFTNYPHIGRLEFPDYNAEEALSVYDHPRVILWKKRRDYSTQKAQQILSAPLLPSRNESWKPREAKGTRRKEQEVSGSSEF